MEAELDRIEAEEARARLASAKVTEGSVMDAGAADNRDESLPADAAPQAESTPQSEEPRQGEQPPEPEAAHPQGEVPEQDPTLARHARAQDKLERVMRLRQGGELLRARQLLYEVLVEGSEDQIFVARNILGQLDSLP
jgi:hypothetical protein